MRYHKRERTSNRNSTRIRGHWLHRKFVSDASLHRQIKLLKTNIEPTREALLSVNPLQVIEYPLNIQRNTTEW